MVQANQLWKVISGVLASLLLVAVTFAIADHANIAVIQEQQTSQNLIIGRLADNQARVLELLARMDERLHILEEE